MTAFPRLLITDLDNTLWDWFAAWHQSFSILLAELVEMAGVDPADLIAQIRTVHQRHHTVEYPNLVGELPLLADAAGGRDPLVMFAPALQAQHRCRQAATRLYPHVRASLEQLRAAGVRIVAYTDADMSEAVWRIRHTGLDGIIDTLYAPGHHPPTNPGTGQHILPAHTRDGRLRHTRPHRVAHTMRKPHPDTLHRILHDHTCDPAEAIYLGDSLTKDMPMAQAAGVPDVHAAYGMFQHRDGHDLLRRVSSWPDTDITRDTRRTLGHDDTPEPTLVCHRFDEILPLFGISSRRPSLAGCDRAAY